VLLVDGSKIALVGEDLPIERGIPVIDRPDWVVMPGIVNAYSRFGLDSSGSSKSTPGQQASTELHADPELYERVLRHGVTTLGLYPAGSGIPGLAVAVKPVGESAQAMTIADDVYLKIVLRSNKGSKKMLRDGFEAADKYAEKEAKAREKWEKDQEKKKKDKEKASKKKDDDKDKDAKAEEEEDAKKAEDEGSDVYVPPEPDAEARIFGMLRKKELRALVSIGDAADYLHFLDALGDEDIDWSLRVPLQAESDLFYVLDKETYGLDVDGIADREKRVVVEARITRHPGTMRERNLPAELARAGAKLVFVPTQNPRDESQDIYEGWLTDVGEVVAKGLDRQAALAALTLEPARMLGLEERLGSLEKDKDANLVFLSGDPFEPSTRVEAVMIEGRIVYGEVNP
jgi:hypothetical protein